MFEFKIPAVGENIKSGNVVKIYVKAGDAVKKDQDLLELETDKAAIPIPSPVDGVVKEILIKEGQDAAIGATVMKIESGAAASSAKPTVETQRTTSLQTAKQETKTDAKKLATTEKNMSFPNASVGDPSSELPLTPSFTKRGNEAIPAQTDVPAAPSVRRFARELGVEISKVPGSGPGGRISMEDVKAYVKHLMTPASPAGGSGGAGILSKALPDFSKFGSVDRRPMTKIRKVTSEHMTHSWLTVVHVTQFDKADITELEKLRKKFSNSERKLTITPFLMKVMAAALKNFPQFNASIDPAREEIILKKYINIGVAVDTEFGLIVPVIRDVDKKSILELTDEVNAAADKVRAKKIMPDDLQGGSMTLTNLGGIGGTAFTPIVNWPEVCILGTARGSMEPVYADGHFIPRLRLPLCLSYDHRVIDGADAARFLRWIAEAVEQPLMMELK